MDRHAIRVFGHLLMGGIWLERRVEYIPKMLGAIVERPGLQSTDPRESPTPQWTMAQSSSGDS
jgi:hypothetical protein